MANIGQPTTIELSVENPTIKPVLFHATQTENRKPIWLRFELYGQPVNLTNTKVSWEQSLANPSTGTLEPLIISDFTDSLPAQGEVMFYFDGRAFANPGKVNGRFVLEKPDGTRLLSMSTQFIVDNDSAVMFINTVAFESDWQKLIQKLNKEFDDHLNNWQEKINKLILDFNQNSKDGEILLARNSSRFGKFDSLDDRLEYLESLINGGNSGGNPTNPTVPTNSFIVSIQHNQGRNPTVKARYYEYAIGTEPSGLGSGPANSFGGINYQDLPIQVAYPDSNKVLIALPLKYASNNQIIFQNGKWYLIAGYQTICFDLGTIDSSKVPANSGSGNTSDGGSDSGSTSGGDSGQDNTNNQVLTPTGLRAGRISDQWAELVWQQGE